MVFEKLFGRRCVDGNEAQFVSFAALPV